MDYQGINAKGRVVINQVSEQEKDEMQGNPAYKFVRFVPLQELVEAPAEVEDAETNNSDDGNNNAKGRRGRKTNREKS